VQYIMPLPFEYPLVTVYLNFQKKFDIFIFITDHNFLNMSSVASLLSALRKT